MNANEELIKFLESNISRWEWAAKNLTRDPTNTAWCLFNAQEIQDTIDKLNTKETEPPHRWIILQILSCVAPYSIPENRLHDAVSRRLGTIAITHEELQRHLSWMKERNLVGAFPNRHSLSDWYIQQAGKDKIG